MVVIVNIFNISYQRASSFPHRISCLSYVVLCFQINPFIHNVERFPNISYERPFFNIMYERVNIDYRQC